MPIFDQGYQHWSGELSGHAWRWLAITRHGVRVGLKSKLLRIVLFVSWLPALVLAGALCVWGLLEHKSSMIDPIVQFMMFVNPQVLAEPRAYRLEVWTLCFHFFLQTELRFSMILVLLVGPSLISQDLRFNALPLYFSRPLRRIDYFLGKLGVIGFFLAMVTIVPSVVAYILGVFFSMDFTIVPETFRLLVSTVVYGLIITLSAGLLILALSSLSRNSRYVALFWIGIWFVSGISASVLQGVEREHQLRSFAVHNPSFPPASQWRDARRLREERRVRLDSWQLQNSRTDWRPLVSYTENLSRVERALLGTDNSWRKLSELLPDDRDVNHFLVDYAGPFYPWYWSALVLLGLFGLSACTLNFPIKSLDRLR
ncbi:MAG TPA: ABC transporter permease subunit [Tepidisphaeraceae bacterium]